MKAKIFFLLLTVLIALISGSVVYQLDRGRRNLLVVSAQSGDLDKVKILVQNGFSINQPMPSNFGFTPLIAAIYSGSTNVAYFLIDAGADVNLPSNDGTTPLMWAVQHGDSAVPLVQYLIRHGARIDIKDKDGITVLGYAESIPPKPALVKVLEEAELKSQH
jgi:ankyrin repeat protein